MLAATTITPLKLETVGLTWMIIICFLLSTLRLISHKRKFFIPSASTVILILIGLYYWRHELDLRYSWIPRRVWFEHKHVPDRTIESQSQETGEWPKSRIVDRISLMPYVYWQNEVMEDLKLPQLDTMNWKKVKKSARPPLTIGGYPIN